MENYSVQTMHFQIAFKNEKSCHELILGLNTRRTNNKKNNLKSLYTDQFQSQVNIKAIAMYSN